MAQAEQVLRGHPAAAFVVDADARLVVGLRGVDDDQAHPRPADAGDLRMARRQADRDDPVDARPVDRATQRPVQRGDELERVARPFGFHRHARRERRVVRVVERQLQGLRRQDPQRPGPPLGQRARDRIGPVVQRRSDVVDVADRLAAQPRRGR